MKLNIFSKILALIGLEASRTSHVEKLLSTFGGFAGILLVAELSRSFVGGSGAALMVASMGASAVLLFAVPHGPLSQPWPVFGGHMVSAAIGVLCAQWIPDPLVAGALAVALAIGAMHYLRCIHPPGGATALTAVMGGPSVHSLGYQYLITPVLLNVVIILLMAVVVNYPFHWRRYPAQLVRRSRKPARPVADRERRPEVDQPIGPALERIMARSDLPESELITIRSVAAQHAPPEARLGPPTIRTGACYSNGAYGPDWAVRQVTAIDEASNPDDQPVSYTVVAGKGRKTTGLIPRSDFAAWARYEVFRNENSWQRVGDAGPSPRAAESAS
jgi:hypothetical protein